MFLAEEARWLAAVTTERPIPLGDAEVGRTVIVREVRRSGEGGEELLHRLMELGFIEGEALKVIAHGMPGREPVAVRVGKTTFALRRFEADHILVVPAP